MEFGEGFADTGSRESLHWIILGSAASVSKLFVLRNPMTHLDFINIYLLRFDCNRRLFEDEEQDLFRDLQSLPRNAALRKLNDLIKRARLAKVHAYIIAELRKDMPSVFGKDSKKKDLIKNIGSIYDRLQREHQISPGDFPDIKKMQEVLQNQDFTKFHSLKPHLIETVDRMLATDIARLMSLIPQEETETVAEQFIKGEQFAMLKRCGSRSTFIHYHISYIIFYAACLILSVMNRKIFVSEIVQCSNT